MRYDHLVVATGAHAILPEIPGVDREGIFILKDLKDGIDIKSFIEEKRCSKAIIVGAGFIAMELSEGFTSRGIETSIVYRKDLPLSRWDPELSRFVLKELSANGVSFIPGESPVAVEKGSGSHLRLVTDAGEQEGDIIVFALGVRPNTKMAREAGLATGASGAIRVDFSQQTSREGVYAVGDCCEAYHLISREWVNLPLGDIANKQGRVAGRNIAGFPAAFPGVVGSQSLKVFALEAAATGLDERASERAGYDPASTIVWGGPAARSMNDARKLGLKLVADRKTGRLLGAQAVGQGGAVWRINTLSACLCSGMDLDTIGYLDLAYSPPFGGSWDLIHIGAQVLKKAL